MFKFLCYTTISILPQNQEKLLNIWLKQTFQKAIMYFKTSEQKLFGRKKHFQYQMRCYWCIFKACVCCFLSNVYFSSNDSPSKTTKNAYSSKKLFSFSRYSNFCISFFPSFSPCQSLL